MCSVLVSQAAFRCEKGPCLTQEEDFYLLLVPNSRLYRKHRSG
eukprot:COSAG01_NODE_43497_length_429_cov_0.900000_1_plen_42_part_10